MAAALRVLFLADDARRSARVLRELQRAFDEVQLTTVGDAGALPRALKRASFDLSLLDHPLAWTDSAAALRAIKEQHPDRARLLLVAAADEPAALRALEIGDIDGYAVRAASRLERLTASVRAALALARRRRSLTELEAHVRGLFDTAPVGLYRATPDGAILEVNDTLLHMMGFPDRRTALAVRAPDLYVDAADRQRWRAIVERDGFVRGFEMQIRRYDGSQLWVDFNARATRDSEGRIVHYEGSVADISARKRAEDALRQSQAQLLGVMNSVPDAIFTVRWPDRVIEYVNDTTVEIFGYAPDELVGLNTRLIYERDDDYVAFGEKLRSALARGHARLRTEQTFLRKNGQTFPAELHGTFVHVEGQPIRFISIIRDVTERKALEAQVRESQKA